MKNCQVGCTRFECGGIGHLKECVNYPESMQQMIDDKNKRIKDLVSKIVELNYANSINTGHEPSLSLFDRAMDEAYILAMLPPEDK